PSPFRGTYGRLGDVFARSSQSSARPAEDLSILRERTTALLRRLRHGAVLHQRKPDARHHRHPERHLRRPRCRSGHDAHPGRRADWLDGARPRTARVRTISSARMTLYAGAARLPLHIRLHCRLELVNELGELVGADIADGPEVQAVIAPAAAVEALHGLGL